ncbi:MAG: TonB-dependent receptor [Chitinophagaceae bacterium]
MKCRFLLLFLLLFCGLWARTQNQAIRGKVKSEDGRPLDGATITVKGTKIATVANSEGAFVMNVPSSNSTLLISSVGFVTVEQTISGDNLDIVLKKDDRRLSEVVVVGYGQSQKRNISGSISRIAAREVENQPVQSFESALQGKAPGVVIENSSGKVGQGIKVRIRGTSSLSASSQPLYVLDGIPLTTASQSDINNEPTNPLADLNPNDIESIDVLKDASASAIYGARATNGVVLITTKKGNRNNKTIVELNTTRSFSKPTIKRGFLNAKEYVQLVTEAYLNDAKFDFVNGIGNLNGGVPYATEQAALAKYQARVDSRLELLSLGTDWRNAAVDVNYEDQQFRKTADASQVDLSVRGGNEKTRFFASGFYNDQEAIVIANRFRRYGTRFNLDHSLNEKISIGFNLSMTRSQLDRISNDNAFSTPGQLVAQAPISPLIDPATGDFNDRTLYSNGLLDAKYNSDKQVTYRNVGNLFANIAFTKELSFRSEFGADILNMTEESFADKRTQDGQGIGIGQFFTSQNVTFNTNNYFNYSPKINEDIKLTALLGMSYLQNDFRQSNQQAEAYPSAAVKNLNGATDVTFGNSLNARYNFLSYFARTNVTLNEKYLLGASARIDGSSRFGPDNRYGIFPAVSAGWILSEEKFLKSSKALNYLKLRGSWGLTGNAEIGESQYLNLFHISNYPALPGFVPNQIGDPKLGWEKTTQVDAGLDFGFLNNRITGEIDWYNKQTKDLLLAVNVPATNGYFDNVNFLNTIFRNLGSMENKGFEILLNSRNIDGKDFKWNTSFNIGFNKNKVKNIQGQVIEGSSFQRAVEGEPIGVFFMPKFLGVDPDNGDALFLGEDDKPTNDYDAAKRVIVGDPNPDFTGGFTNNFSYKGFDLNIFFSFVSGNEIYNNAGRFMTAGFGGGRDNQTRDILNRWQKPGDVTNTPKLGFYFPSGERTSSRWIYDGSYIRLRQLSIGYNLPSAIAKSLKISSARFFVAGTNLWTKTKSPADPEVNTLGTQVTGVPNISAGVDFYTIPQPKTITIGLNVKF